METPPPLPDEPSSPTPAPPPASLISRLSGVFAAPGEVFENVRFSAASTANWLVPAMLLVLVGWIGAALVFSQESIEQQIRDTAAQAIEKQIAKSKMPESQANQVREMGEKWAVIGSRISAVAAPPLLALSTPFFWGFIIWLVGTKIFKAQFGFMKAVEVAGLAAMISLLDSILRILLIFVMNNLFASPSLMLLVKEFDPQNPAHALLGLANVMSFWLLAVRAVGLAKLAHVSFGRAAAWVFGIWLLYTALTTGAGLALQSLGARQ